MLVVDHLAVAAASLDEGVAAVEAALGVTLAGGGSHAHMGTHNRLLGLGDLYLEVIAVDPRAVAPAWPRWFDLDRFAGVPRLTNWVARCDDIGAEVAMGPAGVGVPVRLARGDYRWQMAVPTNGILPFDGCFPALIQWAGDLHPARALPDAGARLIRLTLRHPRGDALRDSLAPRMCDDRIAVETGPLALHAAFRTARGERAL